MSQSSNKRGAGAMTLVEILPHRWAWRVFEAPGVEPVFPAKADSHAAIVHRLVTAPMRRSQRKATATVNVARVIA